MRVAQGCVWWRCLRVERNAAAGTRTYTDLHGRKQTNTDSPETRTNTDHTEGHREEKPGGLSSGLRVAANLSVLFPVHVRP